MLLEHAMLEQQQGEKYHFPVGNEAKVERGNEERKAK